jgi:flagellar biosynthesis protein FliR
MPIPLETLEQMQVFFWVFIRVGALIFMLPLFGATGIPSLWKAGLSFLLAVIIVPLVPMTLTFPESDLGILLGVCSEILISFLLAILAKLFLASVQLAGQFLGFQMGFNVASVMDPQTGGQSTVISQFLYIFTILLFFSINGHHLFIRAMVESFQAVPPLSFRLSPSLMKVLVKISGEMFLIAIKMAAPILVALFLSNLCLGIVARTVPQVNILMIGFPLNIALGLILLGVTLNNLSPFLVGLIRRMGSVLIGVLRVA